MSSFSEILKKYYKRSSNRVVFSNGMSLNRLAHEMWEDLGYNSIDPSVLSKVINGQRSFTKAQVKSFCKILKILQQEEDLLLVSTLSKNVPVQAVESFITPEYLELIDIHVHTIPFLRSEGAMQHANKLASQEEKVLRHHLGKVTSASAERVLLRALSRICLEQARNISDSSDHGVGFPKIQPIIHKLELISEKIGDAESYSRICQSKGDAFYNIKKYPQAAECFRLAAENTDDVYWKLEGLRAYALCLARIGDKATFIRVVHQIDNLIQNGQFADTFFLITVYEALGRSFAFFLQDRSFELLEKAKTLSQAEEKKGRIVVLPKIQIVRSHLTALSLLPNTENNATIEKAAQRGLALTGTYKYTRQEKEIKTLLNEILNT